jgi:hypothetical protein
LGGFQISDLRLDQLSSLARSERPNEGPQTGKGEERMRLCLMLVQDAEACEPVPQAEKDGIYNEHLTVYLPLTFNCHIKAA